MSGVSGPRLSFRRRPESRALDWTPASAGVTVSLFSMVHPKQIFPSLNHLEEPIGAFHILNESPGFRIRDVLKFQNRFPPAPIRRDSGAGVVGGQNGGLII